MLDKSRLTRLVPSLVALALLGVVACRPEVRPGQVTIIGSGGTVSASISASISASTIEPGMVTPPPSGAAQVNVVLKEWSIEVSPATVKAGQVYFLADNQGPLAPHEVVVIKSRAAPDSLTAVEGVVPEQTVNVIGEIGGFAPDTKASGVFNLTPGTYVLICNIVEIKEGQVESHYLLGMHTVFTVTE